MLLLRLAVGSISVAQGANYLGVSGVWLIAALLFVIGAALLIGFLTPIVSIAAALANALFAMSEFPRVADSLVARMGTIDAVVTAVALAILGAGAFSLDAVLFGRREIIIPDVSRSPR